MNMETMNEVIVGIDLGTTQSAVGVVESGFPILLANEEGSRLTPSAVWYGKSGEVEVGALALRRRGVDHVITSVKSLMGRRSDEVDESERVVRNGDGLLLESAAGPKSPEEVSAEILKKLKSVAETQLGGEISKAVITVPAYFHDGQRAATKKAGEMAGLEVVRILSEPTAAALSYGLERLDESSKVVVFDLGGGTFDVSVLEMREGVFEVLATAGDTSLGGDDFDEALALFAADQLGMKWSDLDAMARVTWLSEGRRVKHVLSSAEEATFRVPFVGEVSVSQDRFRKLLSDHLGRMESCCRRALLDAQVELGDLDSVLMVGGSSRIPMVRKKVAAIFGKEPDMTLHPDEAIARGAAIQAGILAGTVREVLLLDVTPLSLGIETMGGLMNILIPRNTTIPCKAGEMFTNAVDFQCSMKIQVLQGERELAKDNWELGGFELPFEASGRGQARVGVEFRIDADGILSVLARDVATGKDTVIEVGSSAVDVTEAKVERMVSQSVEFAFEDMNARVFEEARLKANELLPAVKMALSQVGDLLDRSELQEVAEARAKVEKALLGNQSALLKEGVECLDRATESMATLLIEKASRSVFSPQGD